jgi:hypothetical protein
MEEERKQKMKGFYENLMKNKLAPGASDSKKTGETVKKPIGSAINGSAS